MMGNRFNETMQKLRAQRVRARRYTAMLLVLAMLTSLSVSWRLHQVGTALTTDNEYYCGKEEHVHTDDCYTEVLVCGYEEGQPENPDAAFGVDTEPAEEPAASETVEPEAAEPEVHHHTADCYETVLVEHKELTCGKAGHTHDETCPVDPDTGEFICGFEEHTHTDDCFTIETETEQKLVCGYEEGEVISDDGVAALEDTNTTAPAAVDDSSAAVSEPVLHHHTEACYEKVLTCDKEEHTHTLECLADFSADVETADDWEKYSVGLSNNWNKALLTVAQEQLGYKESEKNFQTDEALGDVIGVHHYTRYGDFYGNPYADWDVAFIAFCQHYAGIPKSEIPQRLGLDALRADMEAMGFAYLTEGEDAAAVAIPGDVVTYNKNGNADDETIGIVETKNDDSLTVISGAVEGAVAEVTVPFADITSTIRVDDAYAAYVGEDYDPAADADADAGSDYDYSSEIAVQPAQDGSAVAVYAGNSDIFNTDGAVNLNDPEIQKNLGMEFTFQKWDGNNWINIGENEEIKEGQTIRTVLNMKDIKEGTFTKSTNGNKAYYQLPYKLEKPLENKNITDENDSSKIIGRLDVNTDGLAIITFNEGVQDFDFTKQFKAKVNVWGEIVAKDDGSGEEVKISEGNSSFVLKKKSDISVEKNPSSGIVEKNGKTYFEYTIKVSSKDGTAGQVVTISDQIKSISDGLKGEFARDSFVLQKKDGTKVTLTENNLKITDAVDGKDSFEISGLDPLGKNDFYTLTYLYEITNINELKGTQKIANCASANYGKTTKETDWKWKDIKGSELYVEKTGTQDTVTGRIAWTVTVKNPSGRDLNGFTVTDTVKTDGVIICTDYDVPVPIKKGESGTTDFKVNNKRQVGTVADDKKSFTYTFPEGSKDTCYRFIYYTTTGTAQTVKNHVDIDKGSEGYDGDGEVKVEKRDWGLWKKSLGTNLDTKGNRLKTKWELTVRSNAKVDNAKEFTVRDYFKSPTNQSGQTMDHYAIKSALEKELTVVGSKKDEKGIFFDVLVNGVSSRVYGVEAMKALGVDVKIHYYTDVDSQQETTADNDKVRSFKITADWKNRTENTSFTITQVHAKGYTTYADNADSLKPGEKITIYNFIDVGDKEQGCGSDYTKPKPEEPKKPQLLKRVATSPWDLPNSEETFEYGDVIWFKLLLKNPGDADTITVEDTLQAGLKYYDDFVPSDGKQSLYVGSSTSDRSGADFNKTWKEPDVKLDYSTTTADGGQVLKFTLSNLTKLNPEQKDIAIIYAVKVTDDYWNNIDWSNVNEAPEKKYKNTVRWGTLEKTAYAIVKRTEFGLTKTSNYTEGAKEASYTIEINKEGKQWLSKPGGKLELNDTLTIPAKIDAEIDQQNITLVDASGNDVTKSALLSCKMAPVETDGTNKIYKMTVTVPDGHYYKLTYKYKFIVDDDVVLEGTQLKISNAVDMFGYGKKNNDVYYRHSGGGGSGSQGNTNTLKLSKIETGKIYSTLAGATFKLWKYIDGQWSVAQETCTTDANGQVVFKSTNASGTVKVEKDVLYRLEETAAPSGYILDSKPHYFLMLSANQTPEAAYAGVKDAKVAEADIRFVGTNQTEQIYVENTAKQITIRKVWQNENGGLDTGTHDPITVKITRYKDDVKDADWERSITLSADNHWTYIYPDTSKTSEPDEPLEDGYTYAVDEESVPEGYNVSYTDSNGAERHTGLTSGDSVTITNMKKTNWLIVEKKWFAEDGTTPLTDLPDGTSITLKLYKVGDDANPDKTKVLRKNDGNNWKWKFTDLEPDERYYVVEDLKADGYDVTYSHSAASAASPGETVTVTNTKKSTKTTLEVVKKWVDTDGTELKDGLPGSIEVQLYKLNEKTGTLEKVKGATLTLNAENGWADTFTDLEPDGQYTVEEVSAPDGYTVSYSVNKDETVLSGGSITVTNTKNAPGYELPATGSTGTAPYTAAGALLMGAALVGGYRRKRKQEGRGE